MRALAVLLASLALAPAAGAWTKLTLDSLQNIVKPSVLVLPNGAELIAYDEPQAGALKVIRNGSTQTLASGLAIVGDPQLLYAPGGALFLYASGPSGVVRYTSSDGGATWSGPVQTFSTSTADVQGGAIRPNGTPLFSQHGTGYLNVYTGVNGEAVRNVFSTCCAYAESLAVDSTGLAQIAFWSNGSGQSGFLYGPVGGSLQNLSGGKDTVPRDDRVPLVADAAGSTFVGWASGYPTSDAFVVSTLRGGSLVHTVKFTGLYSGGDPHMALAVDSVNRVWALWTRQGALWAARSRSSGAHFGAPVHAGLPGTAYQLEAGARADGSVDAVVNIGSSLSSQRLLPGLTVSASRGAARVLDDGFPVAAAVLKGGGRTLTTDAQGRVSLVTLKPHTFVTVSRAGYTPTGFRVP